MPIKRAVIFCLLLAGILTSPVIGGEIAEVELTDGSVLCGEISSSEGGFYTLKSDTLGTVKLDETKIRTIRFKSVLESHAENDTLPNSSELRIKALQQLLTGDPEIVQMIMSLLNDPAIQEILADPSIIGAVNKGDIEALSANPKFMKLLDHPVIQEMTRKLAE
ncbi:MAG: hypothetical protein ACOC6B_02925 [Thermodesulfobacteriota bacterium]